MKNTVLIVGESVSAGSSTDASLRARGLHILRTMDATEACDILCCEGAAVVVLDVTFPDTRGFEVLRRLRGRFETRILPSQPSVVVMADWAESAVERLAVGLGADVFLRKPITPREFVTVVERLVALPDDVPTAFVVNQ